MSKLTDHGAIVAARYCVAAARSGHTSNASTSRSSRSASRAASRRRVEVHHIFPFHICVVVDRPDLELDERNLVTLCGQSHDRGVGDRHLLLGHFDDWESMNVWVRRKASTRFTG